MNRLDDSQVKIKKGQHLGVYTRFDMPESIQNLESTVDSILDAGETAWNQLSLQQARTAYAQLESIRNRLAILDAQFISAFDKELPLKDHKRIQWLSRECGVAVRDARERVQDSPRIHANKKEQHSSKQFMPKLCALTRSGKAGQYAVAKVDRAIRSLPTKLQNEVAQKSDEKIAKLIEQCGPNSIDSLGLHLRKMIGEDEYDDSDRARLRGITVSKQGADGMSSIRGKVTPRLAAVLQRLFADHAKAGDLVNRMDPETFPADSPSKDFAALADPRSPEQRRHDALEAALFAGFTRLQVPTASADNKDLGEVRNLMAGMVKESKISSDGVLQPENPERNDYGVPQLSTEGLLPRRGSTTIVAVTTLEELLRGHGNAFTDGGIHCSLQSLIAGTDCSDLYLQVLDFEEQTLHLGRSRRLGSLSQYLALLGEERISSAPGTSAPAAFCDVHHIQSWESGGETNLDNLTLVDRHVHSQTDDQRNRTDQWHSYRGAEGTNSSPKNNGTSNNVGTRKKVRWQPPDGARSQNTGAENLHPDAQMMKPGHQRPGVA